MAKSNSIKPLAFFVTSLLFFSFILISPGWGLTQEIKASSGQEAIQPSPGQPGSDTKPEAKTSYKTIPITMEMEAGVAQYKQWPGGQKTIHAGIGWIEPFGRSEYVAGKGYPEQAKFPKPTFFNDEWKNLYENNTDLFCIYMLKDGNIYAYDGIVGNLEPDNGDDGKVDYLINVIVGGTGAYEGATGMLLGKTPGRGKNTEAGDGVKLPVSILKLMSGYIKLPIKK